MGKDRGIPQVISSDHGSIFTSKFWDSFQKAMGTNIRFSTAFHPQSQGQVERVNQVLEDMLRACVVSFSKKWEESLPYVEFSYNNSYQASLKMSPFEVLYGRKCRPLWTGQKLGNVHSSVRILSNRPKNKFALFARISRLLSHVRKSQYDHHH